MRCSTKFREGSLNRSIGGEEVLRDISSATTPIPTEAVRFTAFHPKEIVVETWYSLLVYAHLDAVLERVQTDAAKFKSEMGTDQPKQTRSGVLAQIARGTEITIVPTCQGVAFNPERITLKWVEDMHRAEFRFRANKERADEGDTMLITVYVGPLLVATLKSGVSFEAAIPQTNVRSPRGSVPDHYTPPNTTGMYPIEKIFVSYSHADTPMVERLRRAYIALGKEVLIDRDNLRSGEKWNAELMRMIDQADIFQLFWSARAERSTFVSQEWRHALERSKREQKDGFIRPVYWEKPLIPPPPELSDLHFAYLPPDEPTDPTAH